MSSIVWTVFNERDEIRKKAKCQYCKKWFSFLMNTSGLIRHLRNAHQITLEDLYERPQTLENEKNFSVQGSLNALRRQQARTIVSCGLPFSIVENEDCFAENMFSNKELLIMEFYLDLTAPIDVASKRFENLTSTASEIIPFFTLIKKNIHEVYVKYSTRDDVLEHNGLLLVIQKITENIESAITERLVKIKSKNLLKICCLLDPRFSHSQIFDDIEWEMIEMDLLSEYSNDVLPSQDTNTINPPATSSTITTMNAFIGSIGVNMDAQMTEKQSAKKELATFKQTIDQFPMRQLENDAVGFWRSKRSTLPLLSKKALQLLIIPASSASTERIFSGAGRIAANRLRNRLSVESCSALLMVNAMNGFQKRETSANDDYGVIDYEEFTVSDSQSKGSNNDRVSSLGEEIRLENEDFSMEYDDSMEDDPGARGDCMPSTSAAVHVEKLKIPKVHHTRLSNSNKFKKAKKN